MQAWDVTFHYDSVDQACVKAKFEDLGCVILEVTRSWVLRELTNKTILGWAYMVSPGMVVVNGITDLGSMQALNMLVQNIE